MTKPISGFQGLAGREGTWGVTGVMAMFSITSVVVETTLNAFVTTLCVVSLKLLNVIMV